MVVVPQSQNETIVSPNKVAGRWKEHNMTASPGMTSSSTLKQPKWQPKTPHSGTSKGSSTGAVSATSDPSSPASKFGLKKVDRGSKTPENPETTAPKFGVQKSTAKDTDSKSEPAYKVGLKKISTPSVAKQSTTPKFGSKKIDSKETEVSAESVYKVSLKKVGGKGPSHNTSTSAQSSAPKASNLGAKNSSETSGEVEPAYKKIGLKKVSTGSKDENYGSAIKTQGSEGKAKTFGSSNPPLKHAEEKLVPAYKIALKAVTTIATDSSDKPETGAQTNKPKTAAKEESAGRQKPAFKVALKKTSNRAGDQTGSAGAIGPSPAKTSKFRGTKTSPDDSVDKGAPAYKNVLKKSTERAGEQPKDLAAPTGPRTPKFGGRKATGVDVTAREEAAYKLGLKKGTAVAIEQPTASLEPPSAVNAAKFGGKKGAAEHTTGDITLEEEPAYKLALKKATTGASEQPTTATEPSTSKMPKTGGKKHNTEQEAGQEEPIYKIALKKAGEHRTGVKDSAHVETSRLDGKQATQESRTSGEVPAYKVALKKATTGTSDQSNNAPNASAPTTSKFGFKKGSPGVTPGKEEPAYKIALKKTAPAPGERPTDTRVADSANKAKFGEKAISEDSAMKREEPAYKIKLKKTGAFAGEPTKDATEPRSVRTPKFGGNKAENKAREEPAYKIALKKTAAGAGGEEPTKLEELQNGTTKTPTFGAKIGNQNQEKLVEKTEPAFKINLKHVSTPPSDQTDKLNSDKKASPPNKQPIYGQKLVFSEDSEKKVEPAYKMGQIKVAVSQRNVFGRSLSRENSSDSLEPAYQIGLRKVSKEPDAKTIDTERAPSSVQEPIFKVALKKAPAPNPADQSGEPKEVPAYKVALKKVSANGADTVASILPSQDADSLSLVPGTESAIRDDESPEKRASSLQRQSASEKELRSVRSMGLTKAMSAREVGSDAKYSNKAAAELEEIRLLGLTKALSLRDVETTEDVSVRNIAAVSQRENACSGQESFFTPTEATVLPKSTSNKSVPVGSQEASTSIDATIQYGADPVPVEPRTSFDKKQLLEGNPLGLPKTIMTSEVDPDVDEPSRRPSAAQAELEEIRALGLTKAMSNRSVASGGGMEGNDSGRRPSAAEAELEEIRKMGLTKQLSNKSVSSGGNDRSMGSSQEVQSFTTRTAVSNGMVAPTLMTIESEDCVFETDDDSYVDEGIVQAHNQVVPNQAYDEAAPAAARIEMGVSQLDIADKGELPPLEPADSSRHLAPDEESDSIGVEKAIEKTKSKSISSEDESATTPPNETKMQQRSRRKNNKEQFKGLKRFLLGKKSNKKSF